MLFNEIKNRKMSYINVHCLFFRYNSAILISNMPLDISIFKEVKNIATTGRRTEFPRFFTVYNCQGSNKGVPRVWKLFGGQF